MARIRAISGEKGYTVHGTKWRACSFTLRITLTILAPTWHEKNNFFAAGGDLTDSSNIMRLIQTIEPDEICNLPPGHVQVSLRR